MLIETIFGLAVVLLEVNCGKYNGYKVRLTENSVSPGKIVVVFDEYAWEYKDG